MNRFIFKQVIDRFSNDHWQADTGK